MEKAVQVHKKAQTLRTFLNQDNVKAQLMAALPKHLPVDRFLRLAMTTVQTNPKLLDCTRESILASLMLSAQLGLEFAIGQAYLVPFFNKRKGVKEAQFIPGYRGYIDLARRSGMVKTIKAEVVFSRDTFTIKKGLENDLIHIPYIPTPEDEAKYWEAVKNRKNGEPLPDPRGNIIGFYAITWYRDGESTFTFMPKLEVDIIRQRSASPDEGPWVTDYIEMGKKTVIRRHLKTEPMSIEVQQAMAMEEAHLTGTPQEEVNFLGGEISNIVDIDPSIAVKIAQFEESLPAEINRAELDAYLQVCANYFKKSIDEIKVEAAEKMDSFLAAFAKWNAAQNKRRQMEEAPSSKEQHENIFFLLNKLGIKDELAQHEKVTELAGIDGETITSMSALTKEQASRVIKALNQEVKP